MTLKILTSNGGEPILEPEKHLVDELGKPLAVLTDFLDKSKDRTRPARNLCIIAVCTFLHAHPERPANRISLFHITTHYLW